jgi:hypothetical protein
MWETTPMGDDDHNVSEHEASRKYGDTLVIQTLAESEAELREHVASLEADVKIYAALAKQALQQLYEKNVECDRYQARVLDLIGELRLAQVELRALRAQVRSWQEAAA